MPRSILENVHFRCNVMNECRLQKKNLCFEEEVAPEIVVCVYICVCVCIPGEFTQFERLWVRIAQCCGCLGFPRRDSLQMLCELVISD